MEDTYTIAYFHQNTSCVEVLSSGVAGAELTTAERPLSLISLSARHEVDTAELRGLCYQRFRADITLDCAAMPPKGAHLTCGELVLHILPEGKTCWPECILLEKDLPCPLIEGVRFASVVHPGSLCQGDVLVAPDWV